MKFEGPPQDPIEEEQPQNDVEEITLALDPEKEKILTEAARALSARVELILSKVKDDLLSNPKSTLMYKIGLFVAAAKELWPENDGRRVKPLFDLHALVPAITDMTVQFEYYNNNGEFQRNEGMPGGRVVLGLGSVLNAQTNEEFSAATDDLYDAMYHETEHFVYWGSDLDASESAELAIQYLANEGEVRAFAKQYAFRYARLFPGESFDLEKMRTLSSVRGVTNYFTSFADPVKQEKYKDIADVARTFEQIVAATRMYVDYLNGESGT